MKDIILKHAFSDPDVFGEALRDYCFVPDEYGNDVGGYNTFELRESFSPTPKHIAADFILMILKSEQWWGEKYFWEAERASEAFERFMESCYSDGNIILAWHWDGDGTLAFKYKGKIALNNDCKKVYVWEFVKES